MNGTEADTRANRIAPVLRAAFGFVWFYLLPGLAFRRAV